MYRKIVNELNNFLNSIAVPGTPLNPDVFQGVFVKKLSNQNIIKEKRRINAGNTVSTVNQTHIDITGHQGKLFFFEKLNDSTTPLQNIDVDIYANNLKYIFEINSGVSKTDENGNTFFVRQTANIPSHLSSSGRMLYSSAYKKYGHTGD